jgi:tetratricopeptide (TPR) repeat protein
VFLALVVLFLIALSLTLYARRFARPVPAAVAPSETEPVAILAARRAVEEHPDDPGARRRLADAYLGARRPFEAIWELAEPEAGSPDDLKTRLTLAAALEAALLPELAQALLEERAASPADDLARRLALARLHLRHAGAGAAGVALRGVEAQLAASAEGLRVQGRVLQANGDRAGAEAAYRRSLALAPSSSEGHYWLGRLLLEEGRAAEAREVLATGVRVAPSDPRLPFYQGLTYVPRPDAGASGTLSPEASDRARALFQESLRLAPAHALPHYQLGLLDARAGRWGAAADHFQAATEADPAYADAYREMARALRALRKAPFDAHYQGLYFSKVERPEDALRAFREVARARPDSPEGPLLVSRMLIQTMQYKEAAAVIEPALRRFPRDPALYERLSVLYKLTRGRSAVEQLCRQWQEALPQASEPFWVLGKLRVADGRLEEGIHLYEQALAKAPERAEYQLFLGQTLAQRGAPGDLPRALELIGRAVGTMPQDPEARFQYGLLLQRMGRLEEARAQLLRALDLDPHQQPPYNSLATVAAALGRPGQARLFARAIRRVEARVREEEQAMQRVWERPEDAGAHLAAARFRIRTGALPRARAHLQQARELRPGWPEAARELRRVTRALEAL